MTPPRLGIDIGGVIVAPFDKAGVGKDVDIDFDGPAPAAGGLWVYLPELARFFRQRGGDVWLVNKATRAVTYERAMIWLEHHNFFSLMNMNRTNVRFCNDPAEKVDIARELGLTHFVDDRVDVLVPMMGVVDVRVLFGAQDEASLEWAKNNETLHAHDWAHAAQLLKWPENFLPLRSTGKDP